MFGRVIWDKLPESNFKIFQNHDGDLSPKSAKPKMWLLVNHTKPANTLYWNQYHFTAGNYKSAGNYKKNSVNGAMSIAINRVTKPLIT